MRRAWHQWSFQFSKEKKGRKKGLITLMCQLPSALFIKVPSPQGCILGWTFNQCHKRLSETRSQ